MPKRKKKHGLIRPTVGITETTKDGKIIHALKVVPGVSMKDFLQSIADTFGEKTPAWHEAWAKIEAQEKRRRSRRRS